MYSIRFLCAIGLIFFIGNAVVRFLKIIGLSGKDKGWPEDIVISFPLGVLMISLIQLYIVFMKIPLRTGNILYFMIPFLIIYAYLFIADNPLKKIVNTKGEITERLSSKPQPLAMRAGNILEYLIVAYILFLCAVALFSCLFMPQYSWDARGGAWAYYAKIFFSKQTIFTEDFLDPFRLVNYHYRYPLLIPFAQNLFFNILGKADDYLSKVVFSLLYINIFPLLYFAQRSLFRLPRLHSLIFTAFSGSMPLLLVLLNGSVPSGCADFPLACFYTFTIIYLFYYLQTYAVKNIIYAALFATCCLFTKHEGIPLFLLSISIFIFEIIRKKLFLDFKKMCALLVYILLPLLLLSPWFFIRSKLPIRLDNSAIPFLTIKNLLSNFWYLVLIIKYTLQDIFIRSYNYWGIFWILLLVVLALPIKEKRRGENLWIDIYLLVVPLVYYCIFIVPAYMISNETTTRLELEFFGVYGGMSFQRLNMHTLFLLCLFISLRIHRLFNIEEKK